MNMPIICWGLLARYVPLDPMPDDSIGHVAQRDRFARFSLTEIGGVAFGQIDQKLDILGPEPPGITDALSEEGLRWRHSRREGKVRITMVSISSLASLALYLLSPLRLETFASLR